MTWILRLNYQWIRWFQIKWNEKLLKCHVILTLLNYLIKLISKTWKLDFKVELLKLFDIKISWNKNKIQSWISNFRLNIPFIRRVYGYKI